MIKLSEQLRILEPVIHLGIITANIKVKASDHNFIELMQKEVARVENNYTLENYKNETLEDSRKIYRALKKDPSRYRISSDSLIRRIIKKKGIYYVNNIVDINNLVSLKTYWSIGAYDINNISGEIVYGVGTKSDHYEGIGRGFLNIENLPVLMDTNGPFGSATSDSLRTMVTDETEQLLMVVHAFGNDENLLDTLKELKTYLELFAEGTDVKISVI